VSAPDGGLALAACPADIVELAAFREQALDLERLAAARGVALPPPGGIVARSGRATLSVRPGRWLLLAPPTSAGASAAQWQETSGGRGAVVDLSSALAAFLLTGPAVGAALARGCRLDLDAGTFPVGHAAATIMVQVPAILARLTAGMLLLTPATTARHLREWLVATAEPFGLARLHRATVSDLCGESAT
jgi:heterotetrameric sarcosine oxidase gamma subunit